MGRMQALSRGGCRLSSANTSRQYRSFRLPPLHHSPLTNLFHQPRRAMPALQCVFKTSLDTSLHCRSLFNHFSIQSRTKSSSVAEKHQDPDRYAVAILYPLATAMPNSPRSLKLSTKNLNIEQILEEAPGTHARDFFSLSLTSLGDAASRKRRTSYSVNKIHPWFILPRESEIIVSLLLFLLIWACCDGIFLIYCCCGLFPFSFFLRWHLDVYERLLIEN